MSTAHMLETIAIEKRRTQFDGPEMLAHVAHELRQPLSAMESLSCYLEIVLPPHETKAHEQISKMKDLLRQTNWILSDAIHFLQSARAHLVLMDWNETMMEIVSEADATPGLDVDFFLDLSIPPILFDLEQAKHLTLGIYLFLRKLSRGKSIVNVTSKLLPGWVELEFAAIAPNANLECGEEALFEPFSPYAPAGSGLALASAKKIVQAHGGCIEIKTPELQDCVFGLVAISVKFPIQLRSQSHISEST